MAGWGKRTAAHDDKKRLEHDLKALNLDIEFSNYSQWQRNTSLPTEVKDKSPLTHQKQPTMVLSYTVGKPVVSASTACHHGNQKKKKDADVDEELAKKQAEHVKILKLRIKARKQCLEDYINRKDRIFSHNLELREEINAMEKTSHESVNENLRKYEKYRDGISVINRHFNKDMSTSTQDLELLNREIKKQIQELEDRVKETDDRLQEKQSELYVLLNYKDKEYPVKAIKIADLEDEIEDLKITNEEDTKDLEYIISTEIGKMKKSQNKINKNITEEVTEDAIGQMHPSLKEMAMQNMVMKKEIEFHTKDMKGVQVVIEQLEREVKDLLKSPKTNFRLQMFPEFFPQREKCTPDMDVVLDIPKKEWLPI